MPVVIGTKSENERRIVIETYCIVFTIRRVVLLQLVPHFQVRILAI